MILLVELVSIREREREGEGTRKKKTKKNEKRRTTKKGLSYNHTTVQQYNKRIFN